MDGITPTHISANIREVEQKFGLYYGQDFYGIAKGPGSGILQDFITLNFNELSMHTFQPLQKDKSMMTNKHAYLTIAIKAHTCSFPIIKLIIVRLSKIYATQQFKFFCDHKLQAMLTHALVSCETCKTFTWR